MPTFLLFSCFDRFACIFKEFINALFVRCSKFALSLATMSKRSVRQTKKHDENPMVYWGNNGIKLSEMNHS